ncbi:hypothetical protein D3C81_1458700 [compost metagenome]
MPSHATGNRTAGAGRAGGRACHRAGPAGTGAARQPRTLSLRHRTEHASAVDGRYRRQARLCRAALARMDGRQRPGHQLAGSHPPRRHSPFLGGLERSGGQRPAFRPGNARAPSGWPVPLGAFARILPPGRARPGREMVWLVRGYRRTLAGAQCLARQRGAVPFARFHHAQPGLARAWQRRHLLGQRTGVRIHGTIDEVARVQRFPPLRASGRRADHAEKLGPGRRHGQRL